MNLQPKEIFSEYENGVRHKASMGSRGLFEQNKINERFFIGDQWHGAKCGNDRPLVRYNIIKRIGDYKMSQILASPISVGFSAEGIAKSNDTSLEAFKNFGSGGVTTDEVNGLTAAFSKYFDATAERLCFEALQEKLMRNAFISGTGVLYTFWDPSAKTGLFADDKKTSEIKGDIACEVLDIDDLYFGDNYIEDIQSQPFVIIASTLPLEEVLKTARINGADISQLREIENSARENKVLVLTKLFKEYKKDGSYTIKGVKVCENATVRPKFDTGLRLYPLSLFKWERKNNSPFGESEVTFLIPNQIAINRMITASVWSGMTNGMPIMLVNGDTVSQKISNEPGQIIKVYGSNEDVSGAVKYVSPPSFNQEYSASIKALIENTLTQSGANEVALGDSKADNNSALRTMRDASLMPLKLTKNRFYAFVEETARIWADFWVTKYGRRKIKIYGIEGTSYLPFNASRYKDLIFITKVEVSAASLYGDGERLETLVSLFEKGVINRSQLISRLPNGVIADRKQLLKEIVKEDTSRDGI